jgi:hypothetical protein
LIAAWIDLGVPFCGDYAEANDWTVEELREYRKDLAKRAEMEALEWRNLYNPAPIPDQ